MLLIVKCLCLLNTQKQLAVLGAGSFYFANVKKNVHKIKCEEKILNIKY